MPSWIDAVVSSGLVAAVLGFFGVRAINRVDALEKEKLDTSVFEAFLEEFKQDRREARESRIKLYDRLGKMGEDLARLQGARDVE